MIGCGEHANRRYTRTCASIVEPPSTGGQSESTPAARLRVRLVSVAGASGTHRGPLQAYAASQAVSNERILRGAMKTNPNTLSIAIRAALCAGVALAAGVAGTAFAQNTAPGAAAQASSNENLVTLQTITVIGSHVRRVELETDNPMVTVTGQQIQPTEKLTQ